MTSDGQKVCDARPARSYETMMRDQDKGMDRGE